MGDKNKKETIAVHIDTSDNFHPYECKSGCIHCNRTVTEKHNPDKCALCNYNG